MIKNKNNITLITNCHLYYGKSCEINCVSNIIVIFLMKKGNQYNKKKNPARNFFIIIIFF